MLSDTLAVWDGQLSRYGKKVVAFRNGFVGQVARLAAENHGQMTGDTEKLEMIYKPNIEDPDQFDEILSRSHERDVLLGSTSRGAHKDDIQFLVNGKDAKTFGSQGQQRTAALSAKMAEIEIIKETAGTAPVLLLDARGGPVPDDRLPP
jgi:DNA replication and repair protein RecF